MVARNPWGSKARLFLAATLGLIALRSVRISLGVVGAAVYALRLYIRSMHNRVGPRVTSRDIGTRELAAVVPLLAVLLFLAFDPQFGLRRSQPSLQASLVATQLQQRASLPYAAARVGGGVTP